MRNTAWDGLSGPPGIGAEKDVRILEALVASALGPAILHDNRPRNVGGWLRLQDVLFSGKTVQPGSLPGREHRSPCVRGKPEWATGGEQFLVQLGQGVVRGRLRINGIEPRPAEFGLDEPALVFIQLPVVNANLGEIATVARAAAGSRTSESQGRGACS